MPRGSTRIVAAARVEARLAAGSYPPGAAPTPASGAGKATRPASGQSSEAAGERRSWVGRSPTSCGLRLAQSLTSTAEGDPDLTLVPGEPEILVCGLSSILSGVQNGVQFEQNWGIPSHPEMALESQIATHENPLADLITRRSRVRIPPPLSRNPRKSGVFSFRRVD
jgi:hypothetical protein